MMKVNIGPYINWFGPYHFVEPLKYLGVSEAIRDKIADALPLWPFLFIEKLFGKRKVKVRIDRYDTWSADHTLAVIIGPLLRSMIGKKQGVPGNFLPDEYNSLVSSTEFWEEKGKGPLNTKATLLLDAASEEWEATLEKMAWAFEEYVKDDWDEQYWTGEYGEMKTTPSSDKTFWNPITKKDEQVFKLDFEGSTRKCDWEAREKHWKKVEEGIRLFGLHFSNLWT